MMADHSWSNQHSNNNNNNNNHTQSLRAEDVSTPLHRKLLDEITSTCMTEMMYAPISADLYHKHSRTCEQTKPLLFPYRSLSYSVYACFCRLRIGTSVNSVNTLSCASLIHSQRVTGLDGLGVRQVPNPHGAIRDLLDLALDELLK